MQPGNLTVFYCFSATSPAHHPESTGEAIRDHPAGSIQAADYRLVAMPELYLLQTGCKESGAGKLNQSCVRRMTGHFDLSAVRMVRISIFMIDQDLRRQWFAR